jgi:hypothetical protein
MVFVSTLAGPPDNAPKLSSPRKNLSDELENSQASGKPSSTPDIILQKVPNASKLEALRNEICAFDTLTKQIPPSNSLVSEILLSVKEDQGDDAVAKNAQYLMELANERIEKKSGYMRLFSLLIFFCLYSAATLLQREGTLQADIEGR